MKAFHFRLQTNLNLSIGQEKMAQEELQKAMHHREQLVNELNYALDRLHNEQENIRNMIANAEPFARLILVKEYIPVLVAMINDLQDRLNQAEEIVEKRRLVLLERKRETQVLERLKEKEWKRYLHELQLEEQKLIDEVAVTGHYRKNIK
jgi:flagellar FliJ protein